MKKLIQWLADMLGLYTEHDIEVKELINSGNELKAWHEGYTAASRRYYGRKKSDMKGAVKPFKPSEHEQTK